MPRSRGSSPQPGFNAPLRSGWLGGILPVKAMEDNLCALSLAGGAELGEEVEEEEQEPDYASIPLAFNQPRHLQAIVGEDLEMQTWRMRERMKTVSVALVICLNVGVDPPDVIKTQPCARKECWIDPMSLNPQKALETIGNNLQLQYERWQPRARYRQSLDPTLDEVRRLTTGLRRSARDERVLFHYNGHGVPKPTTNGEIWVFNRSYTQYIPLSIYDLQTWMGAPSIYVYDCNNAGIIVESFKTFAEQHEREYSEQLRNIHSQGGSSDIQPPTSLRNCIQLAACSANQLLPMSPELPADLFTSCLTTPIKVALRWFVMKNEKGHLGPKVTLDQLEKIPGQSGDRRTMLGELNWIFTAITDTIAWNTLPRETFQKLFRQDLLVASLFRNFLLAERILRSCDCTPVSSPPLPPTHQQPMWEAWDLALDMCLSQLPDILEHDKPYVPSIFFEEQLTAFEVWLTHGCEERAPPEQLPIVLQVLLSQAHRLRALDLLGRFLDLGPWAVNLVLSVGIYPYVLKLLQANARELRPLLVFLWAKILAVDTSCQQDLVRDQSHRYFLAVLQDPAMLPQHKTWSVFVLSSVVQGYKPGQDEALAGNLIPICLQELDDSDPVLRQWLAICLGRIWDRHEEARWQGARNNAPERLFALLLDQAPEVRAAAVYALGTFLNSCSNRSEHANALDQIIALKLVQCCVEDGSPLVRRELVVALQWVVLTFITNFVNLLKALQEEEEGRMSSPPTAMVPASPRNLDRVFSDDRVNRRMRTESNGRMGGSGKLQPGHAANHLISYSLSEMNMVGLAPTAVEEQQHQSASVVAFSGHQQTPRKVSRSNRFAPPYLAVHQTSYCSLLTVSSSAVIANKFKPFLLKVLGGLLLLEKDPDPTVSLLARNLLDTVWKRMCDKERSSMMVASSGVDMLYRGSASDIHSQSAPSSPMRPSFILGESPPVMSSLNATLPAGLGGHYATHSYGGEVVVGGLGLSSSMMRSQVSTIGEEGVLLEEGESSAISTQFIDWAARYFSTQLMRLNGGEDRESVEHWKREWMYDRNLAVVRRAETEKFSLMEGGSKLDDQIGVLKLVQPPSALAIHPFSSEVVVAGRDTVSVYEFAGGGSQGSQSSLSPRVYSFSNKNSRLAQITALEIVNGHEEGLLMVGTDDGAVRVYRNWYAQHEQVTAWNLLPELVPQAAPGGRLSVGMCLAWDPEGQVLAGSGDMKAIRLWDCKTEMKLVDFPTGVESFVTSMSMSESARLLSVAHGDGTIRLYDTRSPPTSARVMSYREHNQLVLCCKAQPGCRLVSGCTAGQVKIWDMRRQSSLATLRTSQPLLTFDIHPTAPLFAAWTSSQLSVHNLSGKVVNHIRYHEGLLGQRLGPINCLKFHPNLIMLAAAGGSTDAHVSLHGLRKF